MSHTFPRLVALAWFAFQGVCLVLVLCLCLPIGAAGCWWRGEEVHGG